MNRVLSRKGSALIGLLGLAVAGVSSADSINLNLTKSQSFPDQCIGGQFCGGNASALIGDLGVNVVFGDLFFSSNATPANPSQPALVNVAIDGQTIAQFVDVSGQGNFHQVSLGQRVGRSIQIRPATFDSIQLQGVNVTFGDWVAPPPPPPSCQEYDQGDLTVPGGKKKSKTVTCPLGNQFRTGQRYTGTNMPCSWSTGNNYAKLTCTNTHSGKLDANHVYISCCSN